ncbi:MAG: sugar transferase [Nitrospirota bacterium]|jgi:exopolysaccharide biosynthesis polyprenyl glycosylphosphotransferase
MSSSPVRYVDRVRLGYDLLISAFALLLAFPVSEGLFAHEGPSLALRQQLGLLVLIGPIWALALRICGNDALMRTKSRWQQISVVFRSVTVGVGLLAAFLYVTQLVDVPRSVLLAFYVINVVLAGVVRLGVYEVLRIVRSKGRNSKRLLIVGTARRAGRLVQVLETHPDWGMQVAGLFAKGATDTDLVGEVVHGHPVLGTPDDLLTILRREVVDEVIFAVPEIEMDTVETSLNVCRMMGVQARLMLDFFAPEETRMTVERLDSIPLLSFSSAPENSIGLAMKGLFDFALAAVLSVVLSSLLVAIAVAVRLSSPGPILFRQKRCGLNGREFTIYKFRTMVDGADETRESLASEQNDQDGPVFKLAKDPRVTRVGAFLRKTSLDELPQLLNILRGEMSIVGPRPELKCVLEKFEDWQLRRLSVKPGVTGLWQVSGRCETSFLERIRMDLEYIDRWSLALDFKILAMTIPAVLIGRGAY